MHVFGIHLESDRHKLIWMQHDEATLEPREFVGERTFDQDEFRSLGKQAEQQSGAGASDLFRKRPRKPYLSDRLRYGG